MDEDLSSITVDEIPNYVSYEQRMREKEREQQMLGLARRRLNEENERLMVARERDQKRTLQVNVGCIFYLFTRNAYFKIGPIFPHSDSGR